MNCKFDWTTEPNSDGKREARCVLCGQRSGYTLSPLTEIYCDCRADTRPRGNPGCELKMLLAEYGMTPDEGCKCDERAAVMDLWGCDGCKERRAEIIDWLQAAADSRGWFARMAAGLGAGWLVDEAIKRAEAKLFGVSNA